ncbi:MAG: MFS transporter [Chitinophagales bacterium]|nr:MFS transporter [Chitinophagales bacterium]
MQRQTTFYAVVSIFFFWGFLAASNGIFIPFCKAHFQLSQFESQLIDSTFYGGYFIGSLLMFVFGAIRKKDFIHQLGYTQAFSLGLFISAAGAGSMILSLYSGKYSLILFSFFVIALGFCLQQIAANPFVILLGEERTGAHRLNLAGGVNSLGTTIGPLVIAYFLFGSITASQNKTDVKPDNIVGLYLVMMALFIVFALLLRFIKIEEKKSSDTIHFSFAALRYPQLLLGMIAIFVYVGVEVTIQSNMGELLSTDEYGNIPPDLNFPFISLYWGSLMVGRWAGASESLTQDNRWRKLLRVMLPFAAYAVVFAVNYFKAQGIADISVNATFLNYLPFVILMIAVMYFTIHDSAKMLLAFSIAAVVCMVMGLLTDGRLSLMFFISGGLWCSVLWPCIFAQAIKNLGVHTSLASSLLIMMILGGAIIPPLQGWLADVFHIKVSYIITPLCFAYLAFYGWWAMKYNTAS